MVGIHRKKIWTLLRISFGPEIHVCFRNSSVPCLFKEAIFWLQVLLPLSCALCKTGQSSSVTWKKDTGKLARTTLTEYTHHFNQSLWQRPIWFCSFLSTTQYSAVKERELEGSFVQSTIEICCVCLDQGSLKCYSTIAALWAKQGPCEPI